MTRIPRFLLGIGEKEGERGFPVVWTNRIMWAGLAASPCWCLLRARAFYLPWVPLWGLNFNLVSHFSDSRFGDMFQGVELGDSAMLVGLVLCMELNVLGSLIVGLWIYRSELWLGESLASIPGFPFGRPQMLAFHLAYTVLIVFFARRYLARVLLEAFQG